MDTFFPAKNRSFNSRTRKGCDVSRDSQSYGQAGFNSRTRKGCDKGDSEFQQGAPGFQFTHP